MKGIRRWWWRHHGERHLFYTHTPTQYLPGTVVADDIVTRVVVDGYTRRVTGEAIARFDVWGRRVGRA